MRILRTFPVLLDSPYSLHCATLLSSRQGELLCLEPNGITFYCAAKYLMHVQHVCSWKAVGVHSLLGEALILDHAAEIQEGYAQQLSIRAGEVLVTELQLCQMQVCL